MLAVNSEYEDVSMFSPIQLKLMNNYDPRRFKTLYFMYFNEKNIDDLF